MSPFSLDGVLENVLSPKQRQGYQFFQLSQWADDGDVVRLSNSYWIVTLPAAGSQLVLLSWPVSR